METQLSIAIVDDEPEIFALFKAKFNKLIKSNNFKFTFFNNGLECYTELKNSGPVDLILTDISMPVMDGLKLLDLIKNDFPDTKVYMISAYSSDDFKVQAETFGADGFFTKPLDFKAIQKLFEQLKK